MSSFYDNILMGNWAIPLNIGCYNWSWTLYLDKYDYNKPTEYGTEVCGKYWLYKVVKDKSFFTEENNIFEIYESVSDIKHLVSKTDCMDLYKIVKTKYLVIDTLKNQDKIWLVYYDKSKYNYPDENYLSFTDFNLAKQYADFLIRIPYSKYHTIETIKIREVK